MDGSKTYEAVLWEKGENCKLMRDISHRQLKILWACQGEDLLENLMTTGNFDGKPRGNT